MPLPQVDTDSHHIELDTERKIRHRNKLYYRFNHWPIWIFVFFIAPGPLTFDLFEHGFDQRMTIWLACVLVGTGIAGLRGRLPGCEAAPYIIRFTEDRPNPLYRRLCYTFAWSEVITFAVLNIVGLTVAVATGGGDLKQIYRWAYFPMAGTLWALGAAGPKAAAFRRRWPPVCRSSSPWAPRPPSTRPAWSAALQRPSTA